jgi:hypothetical protein
MPRPATPRPGGGGKMAPPGAEASFALAPGARFSAARRSLRFIESLAAMSTRDVIQVHHAQGMKKRQWLGRLTEPPTRGVRCCVRDGVSLLEIPGPRESRILFG